MCISAPEVQAGGLEEVNISITREADGFRVRGHAVVEGHRRDIGYTDEDGAWTSDEAGVAYNVRYWTGLDLSMFGLAAEDHKNFELDEEIRQEIEEDQVLINA